MATGPATGQTFEVNFTTGALTDVSTYVLAGDANGASWDAVSVRQGRSSRFDDVQAGTLSLVLDNADGRWTPDNPLSPYYGTWKVGIGCRWQVTKSALTSIRFRGRIASIEPDAPGGVTNWSRVRVTAVDTLARLARRSMACDFVERWKGTARTEPVDLWPMDETATPPTTFRNLTGTGTAQLVQARSRAGAVTMAEPEGIVLDSCVQLTAANSIGPVVELRTGIASGSVTDVVIPFRTADRVAAGGAQKWLCFGRNATGGVEWSIRLVDNAGQTDLNLYDATGTFVTTLYFGFAPGAGSTDPSDDQWFAFRSWYVSGTNYALVRVADNVTVKAAYGVTAYDIRKTTTIILGGQSVTSTPGKQSACVTAQFGAVAVSAGFPGHVGYLIPNAVEPAQTRIDDLRFYTSTTASYTGASSQPVTLKRLTGRSAFDAAAEVARTAGAILRADYSGIDKWGYAAPDALRSATVTLTVDAQHDLDGTADFQWRQSIDTRPTRVTSTWPGGQVTVVGDENLQQLDDSVDTCAADETSARYPADARLAAPSVLSLASLTIDLAHAGTDLWSAALALKVGDRVRVTNLPSAYYGRTYVDVYALGWTEDYTQTSARLAIDTEPADAPSDALFDDTLRGRFAATAGSMTVTSGTAVGTTSTGTIIVTTSGGAPTFSTSAGDWPATLDWNGELVTVTSAPAGSASPQTLTITARGVAPSVARVHAAGETIDVAYAAAFAF
jgi:hypothetical protein